MRATRATNLWTIGIAGAFLALSVQRAYAPPGQTLIEEVFMYGVDADTNELLRYALKTDEFVSVGLVTDQFGATVNDIEGMARIPAGPQKGFYGTTNFNDNNPTKLIKIEPLDALCTMYADPVGFWKVAGLTPFQKLSGDWVLLGTTKNTNQNDLQAKLIEIDPVTGLGTELMDLGIMLMTGLAIDEAGVLYAVDRGLGLAGEVPLNTASDLYIIHWQLPPGSQWLEHIGSIPVWSKVEGLEFAFGDNAFPIDCSTVPGTNPSWFKDGVLIGFSDGYDMLMIINPMNGNAVEFPGTFQTLDCEGLVFVTNRTDPLYGSLRGFD